MITLRDFEVSQQIQQDALRRAEHERLLLQFAGSGQKERGPAYGQLLSLVGQWMIDIGEFLQRRYSYTYTDVTIQVR